MALHRRGTRPFGVFEHHAEVELLDIHAAHSAAGNAAFVDLSRVQRQPTDLTITLEASDGALSAHLLAGDNQSLRAVRTSLSGDQLKRKDLAWKRR